MAEVPFEHRVGADVPWQGIAFDAGRQVQMGRPAKYSDEFRRDAVALYRAAGGRRTFAAVARTTAVNHETLRNRVRAADAETAVPGPALNDGERAEPVRLRKAEREWRVRTASQRCNSGCVSYRRPTESRPSKAMSNAWSAGFHLMVQRFRPWPVGSRLITAG
ncbi:transposase [Kitasatospora sp. NPDC057015]|uniref:transposase n=1 Tax=Kitasatospora sp. NPDC057015 TaxID=3346001 RepID=UPI00363BBBF2